MRGCRHKRTWTRHRLLLKTKDVANGITDKVCQKCGAQLPLGPSNDDSEAVRIDIHGARIAADWADEGYHPGCDRFEYCPGTGTDELCSFCQARFLAHAIHTHDGEQDGGGE